MTLSEFTKALQTYQMPIPWPGHWINRTWVRDARPTLNKSTINPSRGDVLCEFACERPHLQLAVDSGLKARESMARMPLKERLTYVLKLRQALGDYQSTAQLALRIEAGKPSWEAQEDLASAIRYLEWVSDQGERIIESLAAPAKLGPSQGKVELVPLGVTAAYLPFSTPVTTFAFYFAAAMLAGCPLIVMSSSHAVLSSLLFAYLDEQIELPPGALNILFGNFNSFKELTSSKDIAAVLYTGSREHCDLLRRESRSHVGRQLVLQSGGKNAVIVHSSADLDLAVRTVVIGATKSSGQLCSSTSRVFVYRSLKEAFSERLVAAVEGLKIGPADGRPSAGVAAANDMWMGPLYSQKSVDKFLRFQTMAHRDAKTTLIWGKNLDIAGAPGFYVTPGVHALDRFDPSTAYQSNVLFGPDIAIYDYDVLDEAIDSINKTDASFSVSFMGDAEVIAERRNRIVAPNVLINLPTIEIEATLPLAGRLQSGHHRFHGPAIALYLTYPQATQIDAKSEKIVRGWPKL